MPEQVTAVLALADHRTLRELAAGFGVGHGTVRGALGMGTRSGVSTLVER